jgi:hypothetical protein
MDAYIYPEALSAATARRLRNTAISAVYDPYNVPEPAGDAGDGVDVPTVVTGQHGRGKGEGYTPLPGVLPTAQHLDYLHKLSSASLLTLAFLLLVVLAIIRPQRAAQYLVRGAQRQAGL